MRAGLEGPSRTIIVEPIEAPEIPERTPEIEPERERETTPVEEPVPA